MQYKCSVYGPFGPKQTAKKITMSFETKEKRRAYIDEPKQLSSVLKVWEEQ